MSVPGVKVGKKVKGSDGCGSGDWAHGSSYLLLGQQLRAKEMKTGKPRSHGCSTDTTEPRRYGGMLLDLLNRPSAGVMRVVQLSIEACMCMCKPLELLWLDYLTRSWRNCGCCRASGPLS